LIPPLLPVCEVTSQDTPDSQQPSFQCDQVHLLSRFLRLAEYEEIVITRHGKPAGVLIGFESEEDWLDHRLEHHPEFLRRVAEARDALRAGRGVRL
jgi:prevent-host-death family protein